MLIEDIRQLDKPERRALDESFHPEMTRRRSRGILLSAAIVLLGVSLFAAYGVSMIFFAGLTAATILVSAVEKLTYQRAMMRYESLIRKLVHRVERLEQVPLSVASDKDSTPTIRVTRRRGEESRTAGWSADQPTTSQSLFV
jgi:hypothetical protein